MFFQQASVANIQHAIKHDVSEKAIYRKLFVIGSELLETPVQSERFLYGRLKRRHVVSFLQPRKTGPNTLIYEFVSPEAFHRYLRIATFLGIIDDREDSLLTLTTRGREMMVRGGRNYNAVLAELLEEYWTRNGLQVTAFEDAIHLRIRRGDAPSLRNIHRDLHNEWTYWNFKTGFPSPIRAYRLCRCPELLQLKRRFFHQRVIKIDYSQESSSSTPCLRICSIPIHVQRALSNNRQLDRSHGFPPTDFL